MAALSKPITNKMRYAISISRRNGATMIGLNGIVVKSHGSANIKGFANAIKNAYDEAKLAIPSQIADRVSALIDKRD